MSLVSPLHTTLQSTHHKAGYVESLLVLRRCHQGAEAVSNDRKSLEKQEVLLDSHSDLVTQIFASSDRTVLHLHLCLPRCVHMHSGYKEQQTQTLKPATFLPLLVPPEHSSLTKACMKWQAGNSSAGGSHPGMAYKGPSLLARRTPPVPCSTPQLHCRGFHSSEPSLCLMFMFPCRARAVLRSWEALMRYWHSLCPGSLSGAVGMIIHRDPQGSMQGGSSRRDRPQKSSLWPP